MKVRIAVIAVAALISACNDGALVAAPVAVDATPTPAPEPGEAPVAVISAVGSEYSPLDTAAFDGSGSHDSDGVIVSHDWAIIDRPSGSNSSIQTLGASTAEFFVDFAGDYTIELTVTDDDGLTGSTTFDFSAVPWQTVHVELSWNVDEADVDLHLVDVTAGGQFQAMPYDCYYSNKTPDWGDSGALHNPALDLDDVDGFGPENVNIPQPRMGSSYRILVHYYADDGMGATDATIRVYLNGTLQYEDVMTLAATDKVWDVATIDWPTGTVTAINGVFDAP